MLKKFLLLGCFCTLALASGPALASGFSGTLSADYLRFDFSDLGLTANAYGGTGELAGAFDDTFHGQADISYHRISGGGVDVDDSNIDASGYWALDAGRIGATLGYQTVKISGAVGHLVTYGAFGEFWAGDNVTLGVKGGGFSATTGGGSGYYVGGEAKFYPMPDLAVAGIIGNTGSDGETDYTASAEWLVSEDTPISIGGGYTFSDINSSGNANVWFLKATFYFGDDGAKTLVEHQRTGSLGWASGSSTIGLQF